MENMQNSDVRSNLYYEIVEKFLDASRGHGMFHASIGEPIERLSEFALFLYLIQNNLYERVINIDREGDDVLILKFGPSIEDDYSDWAVKGIKHIALVHKITNASNEFHILLQKLQKSLRLQVQHHLLAAFDLMVDANLSDDEYAILLKYAENYIISYSSKTIAGVSNPQSLSDLVYRLLRKKPQVVYDPFIGTSTLLEYVPNDIKLVGADINPKLVEYTQLKMLILGRECDCFCMDSMSELCDLSHATIISQPPAGIKVGESPVKMLMELFANNNAEEMILIVAPNDCFSESLYSLRKEYTDKNYLDAIILLPPKYFSYSAIPFALLHFRKDRKVGELISVMNAAEWLYYNEDGSRAEMTGMNYVMDMLYTRSNETGIMHISPQQIIDNDYNWNAELYPWNHYIPGYCNSIAEVKICDIFSRVNLKPTDDDIEEILDFSSLTSPFSNIPTKRIPKNVKPVKITEPLFAVGYSKDCMLVYLEASVESPLYVGNNEILYKLVYDKIKPMYLALLFSKLMVEKEVFWGTQKLNSKFDRFIRHQIVPVIPIPEQIIMVEDAVAKYHQSILSQHKMERYIEEIKTQYKNEVSSRKHNMRPYLRELKASNDIALEILNDSNDLDELKAELLPLLLKMEKDRKHLSEIIDHLSQIDKFAEEELIDVLDFVSERMRYHAEKAHFNMKISMSKFPEEELNGSYYSKTYGTYALISSYDFGRMIDCIVENAVTHGFDGDGYGHNLNVDIDAIDMENWFHISFTNDGNPLPEGFDINRYGLLGEKAGKYAGTGDGGHQVVSIANHFGGYVTLESSDVDAENPFVTITVHLPIYDKDYYDHLYDDIDLDDEV